MKGARQRQTLRKSTHVNSVAELLRKHAKLVAMYLARTLVSQKATNTN